MSGYPDLALWVELRNAAAPDDPETVARYADWPVNENDLHARHVWLVERKEGLQARLEGDPDFYDPKIAGWWAWGIACWIGSGFCSGKGPWRRKQDADGNWLLSNDAEPQRGAWRQLVHLGTAGQGVNRQLVHLGNAGRGVNRQLVHLGNAGQEEATRAEGSTANGSSGLLDWFDTLAARLARVRVCCGDWRRVCGPTPTVKLARPCGVFLDPPYADTAKRTSDLYRIDSESVAHDVREWALAHGDDPAYRICLAGYDGEHSMPKRWQAVPWKASGGYSSQGSKADVNRHKERIWFSPHCLKIKATNAA